MELVGQGLRRGLWEGTLLAAPGSAPALRVSRDGQPAAEVQLTEVEPGRWLVRWALPAGEISDGTQVFLIEDASTGQVLDAVTVLAGEALAPELRAEVALLRAELDLLKSAFRRHVASGD